ncbi:hypothetical protein ACJMK2_041653 [Sinanodonta woodiana]|uniref:Uncharacterized protein n=1 Tax=Sinanodonta woodiana TaxID=1069815 RepID=A0ABD3W827_SINWO
MSRLAVENSVSDDKSQKRMSIMMKDGEAPLSGPNIRRISRFEPRSSVQMGLSNRRMSQASRTSVSGTSIGTRPIGLPVKLQNTYRIEPNPSEKFEPAVVSKMMKGVMESYLDGEKYDPKLCRNLAQNLSDVIKTRVKDLGYPRYKLICTVTIGQKTNQGMQMASRCLWNKDLDSFAEARYSKDELYAVAVVYATYYD